MAPLPPPRGGPHAAHGSDGLLTSTDFILISLTMAYGIGRNIALERNKADFL